MENVNLNLQRNRLKAEMKYWGMKLKEYSNAPFAEPARIAAQARIDGCRKELVNLIRNGGASVR